LVIVEKASRAPSNHLVSRVRSMDLEEMKTIYLKRKKIKRLQILFMTEMQ